MTKGEALARGRVIFKVKIGLRKYVGLIFSRDWRDWFLGTFHIV